VGAFILAGCAAPAPVKYPPRNPAMLSPVILGMPKAEVLQMFGAPRKIEIEDKKFKYTYYKNRTTKVTIQFDEQNRVTSVSQ